MRVSTDGHTHTHGQTQNDFIICPMLYAIAMGQIIIRQRILMKGCIAVSSPLAAANGFVRPDPVTWFLGLTRVCRPNGISMGSVLFAWLTNVTNRHTDRHTDRPRYSVCSNRPLSLAISAMRPNNSNNNNNNTHGNIYSAVVMASHCES